MEVFSYDEGDSMTKLYIFHALLHSLSLFPTPFLLSSLFICVLFKYTTQLIIDDFSVFMPEMLLPMRLPEDVSVIACMGTLVGKVSPFYACMHEHVHVSTCTYKKITSFKPCPIF